MSQLEHTTKNVQAEAFEAAADENSLATASFASGPSRSILSAERETLGRAKGPIMKSELIRVAEELGVDKDTPLDKELLSKLTADPRLERVSEAVLKRVLQNWQEQSSKTSFWDSFRFLNPETMPTELTDVVDSGKARACTPFMR